MMLSPAARHGRGQLKSPLKSSRWHMNTTDDHLWYKDTDESGGMYVEVHGVYVALIVSPAYEYLSPSDARSLAAALIKSADMADAAIETVRKNRSNQ